MCTDDKKVERRYPNFYLGESAKIGVLPVAKQTDTRAEREGVVERALHAGGLGVHG